MREANIVSGDMKEPLRMSIVLTGVKFVPD